MYPACRPCGSVEGCLHSVYERKVWHGVQTEDGQVRPYLWLLPVMSAWPCPPPHRLPTLHSTNLIFNTVHTSCQNPCSYISIHSHSLKFNGTDNGITLQVQNFTLVEWSKWIQIYYEFIKILQSIVKPNLPQPLPPQFVPTAVYVYLYVHILTRVRPI